VAAVGVNLVLCGVLGHLCDLLNFGSISGCRVRDPARPRLGVLSKMIGVDPYAGEYESKASLLRRLWREQPDDTVRRLNVELLDHWQTTKTISSEAITPNEKQLCDELRAEFSQQTGLTSGVDPSFLNKDFGAVNLEALPEVLTATDVIGARMAEIDKALTADAPLAVIFLVGSTLEGLLAELAFSKSADFVACPSAPKQRDGTEKPLHGWTLAELIAVARDLHVLSEDVAKHADQVRNFRNYIHPRQQLKEGFAPRAETARIAQQVLINALKDLEALHAQPQAGHPERQTQPPDRRRSVSVFMCLTMCYRRH